MINQTQDTSCTECAIVKEGIFSTLNQDEREELLLSTTVLCLPKGSTLYKEGSRMRGFYCIQKGIIKIYKTGIDGKDQIIRFAKKGDIIGYRSVLSNEAACTSSEVNQDAVLCHIPTNTLFNLVKTNGEFALQLMKLTCAELGEANVYITDIAQKTVKQRLAEVIYSLFKNFQTDENGIINIQLTREEIANMVGTSPETIIRMLSELNQEQKIDVKGRKIKILDIPGLKNCANM